MLLFRYSKKQPSSHYVWLHLSFGVVYYASISKEGGIMTKKDLLNFMRACGFEWICDLDYFQGTEWVASQKIDSSDLWWRPLEVEGSGFTQLFKGSIREACRNDG